MEYVGVEPSGEAFNELSLKGDIHRPKNPTINAGRPAAHSLLLCTQASPDARV
ncbi:glutaminase [Brevibacterium permense]|uniref:glutaminase n=1 Tax=Brevibacterium permense TaxID=234834 RepID=UPI0021CE0CE0|nr:glutaminase [Brevibacterium permense]